MCLEMSGKTRPGKLSRAESAMLCFKKELFFFYARQSLCCGSSHGSVTRPVSLYSILSLLLILNSNHSQLA